MLNQLWVLPSIIGTIISIIGLSLFARSNYDSAYSSRTLSEIAAVSVHNLKLFRIILYPCAILFGVTIVLYPGPFSLLSRFILIAGVLMCLSEMILATIPDSKGWSKFIHLAMAYIMGASMYCLVVLFAIMTTGAARILEIGLMIVMTILIGGTLLDRKRFLFYELPFIFLSHLSVVIWAYSLAF